MATQRITIVKIGGMAADLCLSRLQVWAAERKPARKGVWSSDQWPLPVRVQADAFAERLRRHSLSLPLVFFVEWSDFWSMGDTFELWLTPPESSPPLAIQGDRYEIYGYSLPDGGRLERHLARAGPQQFTEYDQYVRRLLEAVEAWQKLATRATIIVLREVMGATAIDEEISASLTCLPDWLVDG